MLALINNWSYALHHPYGNGITIFVSGMLLGLALYHFLLYFQHKDKTYLYYGTYTFLIFIYIYYRAKHFFLADITINLHPQYLFFASVIPWIFNIIYLLFAKTYIDLKLFKPKWNRIINWLILTYSVLIVLVMIHALITGQNQTMNSFYTYFYIPSISLLSLVIMGVVLSIETPIKYYLVVGSIVYLIFTNISYFVSLETYSSTLLFYIAILVESIFFALGLGAKQKKILMDKNKAQVEMINEQIISIQLKEKVSEKLDKEVAIKTQELLDLTKKHEKEQKEKLALEYTRKTLELRMKAVQTQMNPQFLYNALNALKHYIITNQKEDASYFLSKLSKLLRKILDNTQSQEISLYEELSILELYMEVENMRLHETVLLHIHVENRINTHTIKLPPLILQPLVENAIWHGLSLKKGEKRIHVTIKIKENDLLIFIKDNGIGREQAAINKASELIEKESIGIDLTKERLEAYTINKEGSISITFKDLYDPDENPIGTEVRVKIPQQ